MTEYPVAVYFAKGGGHRCFVSAVSFTNAHVAADTLIEGLEKIKVFVETEIQILKDNNMSVPEPTPLNTCIRSPEYLWNIWTTINVSS